MKKKIEDAIEEVRKGNFVLVYDADGREEETDFFISAEYVKPDSIYKMRKEGGGLIFIMSSYEAGAKLGLPYLADVIYKCSNRWPVFKELIPNDIPYDTKSSFSLTINHRKTFTGIRDIDRALTISEFGKLVKEIKEMSSFKAQRIFGERFRSPGHIPICIASKGLLNERNGHTELGIAIAEMAEITPAMAGCEMLDFGESLKKEDAIKYAEKNGYIFLEGKEIIEAWKKWSE
ncbi:MAG TPA: 3,4-dihydroxy-2-butanone-4-phosphate synthase [Thermoplasmatales archaeon]|nr:3,4-dihydroxy-2-butanone-4-phosphate synthase [Thermoplasmatales archaeon]